MKKRIIKSVCLVLAVLLLTMVGLTGCASKDYSQEILGTWYCWHWYYNIEGGDSGFYEENRGFFEQLRTGAPVYCDLAQAIQSVEIADCIRNRKKRYEK